MSALDHQNIEILAYALYVGAGRPKGQSLKYWLEAKNQLETNLFDFNFEMKRSHQARIPNRELVSSGF